MKFLILTIFILVSGSYASAKEITETVSYSCADCENGGLTGNPFRVDLTLYCDAGESDTRCSIEWLPKLKISKPGYEHLGCYMSCYRGNCRGDSAKKDFCSSSTTIEFRDSGARYTYARPGFVPRECEWIRP